MNKNLFKNMSRMVMALAAVGTMTLVSCNPEPDESDMFTATGETAADYIKRKPELSSFDMILNKIGIDRNLSSYGIYTCFIPTNEAVTEYITKLYNDESAKIPHNGLTAESLEALIANDSLCRDIALYHLHANEAMTTIDIGNATRSISTMLRVPFTSDGTTGKIVLNNTATIIQPDSTVTNGVVHVINAVIPRNTRLLMEEIERHTEFSIFAEALRLTGLCDSIVKSDKGIKYTISNKKDVNVDGTEKPGECYAPEECLVKYTIFAEPNSVLAKNNINSLQDLIQYANSVYGGASDWYDYVSEKGISISTGNDYTNRFNALNMFVAYHILYAGMPEDELVYENSPKWQKAQTWNYCNGAQPFDYYETMLPHTILKIWQPEPLTSRKSLYINRYVTLNTLTDDLGTMGSSAMHQLETGPGMNIKINRTSDNPDNLLTNIQTYNGYIHSINDMLIYNANVPQKVLHERLRFDSTTFLVEMINNGIRMSNATENRAKGSDHDRVAFPLNYFDNVVSYTPSNCFRYNIKGAYNAWQSDTFQGWGDYDLAIKLPSVPTGTYEFRIFYTPMGHGGMMQFYMGTSSNQQSMMALDIPLDVRIPISDPSIGSTPFYEEEDLGVATDAALRNRGFMRGLFSYVDHPEKGDANNTDRNQRSDASNASLRKLFTPQIYRQSEEYWFRIKNVISDGNNGRKWQFDYIEFVPMDIINNDTYAEDWY